MHTVGCHMATSEEVGEQSAVAPCCALRYLLSWCGAQEVTANGPFSISAVCMCADVTECQIKKAVRRERRQRRQLRPGWRAMGRLSRC